MHRQTIHSQRNKPSGKLRQTSLPQMKRYQKGARKYPPPPHWTKRRPSKMERMEVWMWTLGKTLPSKVETSHILGKTPSSKVETRHTVTTIFHHLRMIQNMTDSETVGQRGDESCGSKNVCRSILPDSYNSKMTHKMIQCMHWML